MVVKKIQLKSRHKKSKKHYLRRSLKRRQRGGADYATLVGDSYVHVEGPPKAAAFALHDAINSDRSDIEEYHMRVANAMLVVAELWSPLTFSPIPIFRRADEIMEETGEPVTIDWSS